MLSTRADVEQLLEQRVPFVRIEEYIEGRCDISEDDRDGLWLYAWSRSRTPGSHPAASPLPSQVGDPGSGLLAETGPTAENSSLTGV